MALCPFARHRLIPPGSNDPSITAVGAVLHVDAGNAESLYAYFNGPSGGIESHFHIAKDGTIEQYRDTSREADANYRGNSWTSGGRRYGLISIETQGYGSGEWTSAQLASIKRLLAWLSDEHNFPLRVAPSWQGPGVGYHVMFGAPGPWTPVAKSCPGPDRIEQFNDDIVPWMSSGADPQEDELKDDERKALMDLHHALVNGNRAQVDFPNVKADHSVRAAVQSILGDTYNLDYRVWSRKGGLDYVNDKPSSKAHQLSKAHQYSLESLQIDRRNEDRLKAIVAGTEGLDQDRVEELIQQGANEAADRDAQIVAKVDELSEKADGMVQLLEDFESGALDAEQVVQRLVELKADMYADAAEGDGDAA